MAFKLYNREGKLKTFSLPDCRMLNLQMLNGKIMRVVQSVEKPQCCSDNVKDNLGC